MFEKGDIVRCTNSKYTYTSYMRPCTVQGYDEDGKLIIKPFNKNTSFNVDSKLFEIVPTNEILRYGQEINLKGCEHTVIFERYLNNGMIQILNNHWREEVKIERVIFIKGVYI